MICGIISPVTVMQARFVFSPKSRLSVRASHDCDKHEKRQVGGFLREVNMKRCKTCEEIKPLCEFYKNRKAKDGRQSICKVCQKEYDRQYRVSNVEKIKVWFERVHDKRIEYNRKYHASHKKERHEHYLKNKPRLSEQSRAWKKSNPEKNRLYAKNRSYNEKGAGGKITLKEWGWLKDFYNHTCLCCGRREPSIKLTLDHVVPIALGGQNAINNAQPLCVSCNSSKGKKHIDYRPANVFPLFSEAK